MVLVEEMCVGWKPCVCVIAAKVVEQHFDGCKFSTVGMNLSRRESVQAARQHPARHQLCSVTVVKENRRVSVEQMHLATSLCRATLYAIINKDLHKKKVYAFWFSMDLKTEQKEGRVQNCQETLPLHNNDPQGFFARLVLVSLTNSGAEKAIHAEKTR